jgi:hypothetical protein
LLWGHDCGAFPDFQIVGQTWKFPSSINLNQWKAAKVVSALLEWGGGRWRSCGNQVWPATC